MADFIESFIDYTDGLPTSEIFRLWGAISTVSGALERRVWAVTARRMLYPNLYVLLTSTPGKGKSVLIDEIRELWQHAKPCGAPQRFYVAPNNVTKAALIDRLAKSDRKYHHNNKLYDYHSLLAASSEFSVLVPAHDLEFLGVVNDIYDNPPAYREERRTMNKDIDIANPHMTIVSGAQPGILVSLLPEEAWAQGFTSRLIMVYSAKHPDVDLFPDDERSHAEIFAGKHKVLLAEMQRIAQLFGQVTWTPEAKAALTTWAKTGAEPVPQHSKLEHYCARRVLHIIKLCIISCVSRSSDLQVTQFDFARARQWLLDAEEVMPDIFREMVSKSDAQVIQELHFFMFQQFAKSKQKPLHVSMLNHFLVNRVPSDKITKIIEIAEKSNIIARNAGTDYYYPRPKQEHGVE